MKNFPTVSICLLAFLTNGAVFAQKTVGEHVDDPVTTARVKMALLENSVSDATDINVETSKGIVQLAGFVDSESTKSTAGKIAANTEGVIEVSNRLNVRSKKRSAGKTLDDTILHAKVKVAMAKNDATSALKVNVEIREGSVELSGFVDTYGERDAAVILVSGIDGVKDVINSIDITR